MTGSRTENARGPVRRPWRFDLSLERDGEVSLETQLTRALVREIQRGRLPPGSMLPGSRTLAEQLGVNRKVIVAAVDELVAQGWLETIAATGTRVATTLPQLAVADAKVRAREAAVPRPAPPLVTITDGLPDARLAPLEQLGRAYRRALRTIGRAPSGYVDPAGDPELREVLAEFVNQARGLSTSAAEVFLTRGSQGALALYALSMLAPGDVVGVETPGYAPAWRAFEFARARVVHIPVDADGIDTTALEQKARSLGGRLRAVYVTPHHQYPTSVSLTPERRMHLLRLAERFDFTVLEDDYDYEYHFDGHPRLPLQATAGARRVVYIASLSKLLAPAIRLGYLVADPECIRRIGDTRRTIERQGDPILERAIAELFEDGEIQRHARRARRVYAERRDHLVAQLAAPALQKHIECTIPGGGLALWLRLRRVSAESVVERGLAEGLRIAPGSTHLPKHKLAALRFGFAAHDTDELTRIIAALARCFPR